MLSEQEGCPLLGCIPFDDAMTGGDAGTPAVVDRPQGVAAAAFRDIADRVIETLAIPPAGAVVAGEEGA